ncbi:MAG: dihydrodipicolinate synthase family protein, partial [Oscillospiraceae bacterium]|nr:dihydrodipicolinate synthase family protein [Oscillospiraceae bacterium]
IFAVCQSSEIFFLSFDERLELLKFIMKSVPKGLPVIASGHVSDDFDTAVYEAEKFIETGIDAFVFISNRFAKPEESDELLLENMLKVVEALPEVGLGVYECPYPYKRLLSPAMLKEMVKTGKFRFLKDTCCNIGVIKDKLEAVRGSGFKIFNANAALLLDSLYLGCSGFSGVMANFTPELYAEICDIYETNPERARIIQDYCGFASLAERQAYPINAKYYLTLDGVDMKVNTRSRDMKDFPANCAVEIDEMYAATKLFKECILNNLK